MKKKILFFPVLLVIFSIIFSFSIALAKNNSDNSQGDIPEEDGTYNVPGHPELKVRVFVYKAKPEPSPSPLLVCGLTDPSSNALVDPTGWHLPANWTYNLNPSSVPGSVGGKNLPAIASNGFGEWISAANNKINISRGADTTIAQKGYDGKNIIAWGRTSGSALAVTYTWYYPSTGLVAEVDTIMNQKFIWSWTPYDTKNLCADANSYDAQDILTHELGHWLGLNDEYASSYVNNTMYGYGSKAEVKKDTLTSGDIAGIKNIY